MFRTIKSELMKYFSGKMIYICAIITVFLTTINYIAPLLLLKFNPGNSNNMIEEVVNISSQEYILQALLSLISNGAIFIIIVIIVSSIITDDYGKGTMKYSLLATSKQNLIIGKIITTALLELFLIMAALLSSSIVGVLAYEWSSNSYSIMQIIGTYLIGWLTLLGFTCFITFATQKISSTIGAIGLGIGIYFIIGIIGIITPETYKSFIITCNISKILDMTVSSWAIVATTNIIYIIIFSILSVILFKKKEVLC